MPVVQMICMANSRSESGRCVAGLRLDSSSWIRPVNAGTECALSPRQHCYTNILDLIEVNVTEPAPKYYHPEDWLIDGCCTIISSPAPLSDLALLERFIVREPLLFGGHGDRISDEYLISNPIVGSLLLIEPEDVKWEIIHEFDKWKTRGIFKVSGEEYNLRVTDPVWERDLRHLGEGRHSAGDTGFTEGQFYFTISLSTPFNGYCYKLIAAVIDKKRFGLLKETKHGHGWQDSSPERQRLNEENDLPPRAYAPWSKEEELELQELHTRGLSIEQLAHHFERQLSAIHSRLEKLGIE